MLNTASGKNIFKLQKKEVKMQVSTRVKNILLSMVLLLVPTFIVGQGKHKAKGDSCCELGLSITDAQRKTATFITSNLSADGTKAFVGYGLNPAPNPGPEGDIEAELFANNNGTLNSLGTIRYDAEFPGDIFTTASPDLQNLYVGDTNGDNTIRIRHFSGTLGLINFVQFPDYKNNLSMALSLSPDGKYLALSYLQTEPDTLIVRILNAQTLETISTATVIGDSSNGSSWFTLCPNKKKCKKPQLHLAITSYVSGSDGSSTLSVFRFDGANSLQLIDSAPLPFDVNAPTVTSGCHSEALIAVLAAPNYTPSEPSVMPPARVANRQSHIQPDTNNLRIYAFGGQSLNLVYSEKIDGLNFGMIEFHPNNRCLLVSQKPAGLFSSTGTTAMFRCIQRYKKKNKTECVDARRAFGPSSIVTTEFNSFGAFNEGTNCENRGTWFLTGGDIQTGQTGLCTPIPARIFNNLNLYRVAHVPNPCCKKNGRG